VSDAWYTNTLIWSPKHGAQCYEYTCKVCGEKTERLADRGYEPPLQCYRCRLEDERAAEIAHYWQHKNEQNGEPYGTC
jgi:hypothetical protein